jgi:hypothetical protein
MSTSQLSQCHRYTIRCSSGHLAAAGEAIITVSHPEDAELFVDLDAAWTRARMIRPYFTDELTVTSHIFPLCPRQD